MADQPEPMEPMQPMQPGAPLPPMTPGSPLPPGGASVPPPSPEPSSPDQSPAEQLPAVDSQPVAAPPPQPPATYPAAAAGGAHQGAQIPSYPPEAYGRAGAPQSGPPPFAPYAPPPYGAAGYGPPAVPPPGMYYDEASGVMLPQGVQLASVGRRIGAWFLSIVLIVVTLGIGYLAWGAVAWANGTSPALQVLGMKVWRPVDGRPAGWGIMALRDIVGSIVEGVLFGVLAVVSFVMFLANRDHKSLKDMIASTVVVHDPNKVLG